MTYIGSKPANKPVNQTDIEDDAISLAKLAGGTDGNIISYDASGNPVAIATGNDGQVLTSTGAGSPPAFEAAPSSTADGFFATSGLSSKDLGVGLHIKTADSGASVASGMDELVLENSSNTGLTILSATNGLGRIAFGDSGDNAVGTIDYNHDGNLMKFGTSGALGLQIDGNGHVTKPLQPFFAANATSTNIALTTQVTVQLNERIDTNGDLASNTFTAPVTGKYYLGYHFYLTQLDGDHSALDVKIATSNKTYAVTYKPESTFNGDVNFGVTGSQICDMDAGDTATFVIYISGGAAQTDVHGDSTASGMLIG